MALLSSLLAGCQESIVVALEDPHGIAASSRAFVVSADAQPLGRLERKDLDFPLTFVVRGDAGERRGLRVDALDGADHAVARGSTSLQFEAGRLPRATVILARPCDDDTQCDDGVFCNGAESCMDGACAVGENPCGAPTAECAQSACVEELDACTLSLHHDRCEPRVGTGGELIPAFCDVVFGCSQGSPCESAADCDDGRVCSGDEACIGGRCVPGVPPPNDDENPCTFDACVDPDGVVHVPVATGTACALSGGEAGLCVDGTCGASRCGDGFRDRSAGEICDDGSDNSDETPNACRSDCRPPRCGDGVFDDAYQEECDDGENDDLHDSCLPGCTRGVCGDGFLDPALEGCDDGNLSPGDGCDATCGTEDGFLCLEPGSPCLAPLTTVSPPLPNGRDVIEFVFSPDGEHLAFVADLEEDEKLELYAVDRFGRNLTKLSPPVPSFGEVTSPRFAPGTDTLVYLVEDETLGVYSLYASSLSQAGALRLSDTLVAGGSVLDFTLTHDGTRVVYRADALIDETPMLFSSTLDGASRQARIGADVPTSSPILQYDFTPDGESVVVRQQSGLYRVPLSGAPASNLTPPVRPAYRGVHFAQVTADHRVVVIQETSEGNFDNFVSRRGLNGEGLVSVRLSPRPQFDSITVSPDARTVALIMKQGATASYTLSVAALDTQDLLRLAPSVEAPGQVRGAVVYQPDARYVLFRGDLDDDGVFDLYRSHVEGGEPTLVSAGTPAGESVESFRLDASQTRVLYVTSDGVQRRLYAKSLSADVALPGTPLSREDEDVVSLHVGAAPYVVVRARPAGGGLVGLFSYDLDSDTRVLLLPESPSPAGSVYEDIAHTLSGDRIGFRGHLTSATETELYVVPPWGASSFEPPMP